MNSKCLLASLLFFCLCGKQSGFTQQLFLSDTIQWIDIGDLDIAGDQLTLEALIYMTRAPISGVEGNILSKHTEPANVNYLFRPFTFELTTYQNGNSGPTDFYKLTVPVNYDFFKWYHVAATYDGRVMRYYVNGCLVNEILASGNLFQNDLHTAIGQRSNSSDEQFFGYMDEVRIWNKVRTEVELQTFAESLFDPLNEAGLVAYYTFEGNWENEQGNTSYNGQAVGTPQLASNMPVLPVVRIDSFLVENVSCFGANDGTLEVFPASHTYALNGGSFTADHYFDSLAPGIYRLRAKNEGWCITASESVVVEGPPLINTVEEVFRCPDENLIWNNQLIVSAGTYERVLIASNGCDSIATLEVQVPVNDFLGADTTVCPGNGLILRSPNSNTLWSDGRQSLTFTVQESGIYTAEYIDENDCLLKDTISFIVRDPVPIFVPNAFSPNGDGFNDVFLAYTNSVEAFSAEMHIYDRWGNQVFESSVIDQGWDGRFRGKELSTGVFVWMLRISTAACGSAQTIVHSGDLLLLR